MTASFHHPGDLRSLVLVMRGKCRNSTLTPADVARYCERIEANAGAWERERRSRACLSLFGSLGLAATEQGLAVVKQGPEITGR